MKVLVVGLGSIAKRHIQNIKKLNSNHQIFVWRQHSKEKDIGELSSYIRGIFFEKEDAWACEPDSVLITNPAPFHVETALDFARRGSHLFIEKPLSMSLKNIDVLLKECEEKKIVLMVGYVLRFFEPLQLLKHALIEERIGRVLSIHSTVGQYLPDWRPTKDYRNTVSGRQELGGGVTFELSHELDYLRWLLGEVTEVRAQMKKISNLEIDVEDMAEIVLNFESGAMASIHLDMIDHAQNRSCRIIGTDGTLVWDSEDNDCVKLYSLKNKQWIVLRQNSVLDRNEMYLKELKHFFDCIEKKKQPLIAGLDGHRVVEIALAAKMSAQEEGRAIKL